MIFRVLLGTALVCASSASYACSTCKCGDYTLTLLGAEKPYANRLRFSFDYQSRSESAGQPGVDEEFTDEDRLNFGASYSVNRYLTLGLRVPYVHKRVEQSNLAAQEASGLGDIDLISRVVLYRPEGTGRNLAGLLLGVRLPTASQVKGQSGEPKEIDVQPDARALAPNVGAWYGYYAYPVFVSTSMNYFFYGNGAQKFSPGNAASASVTGQYSFLKDWALQLGLDTRYSQMNKFSNVDDPDSGGFLGVVNLGVAKRIAGELLIHAGVQLPAIKRLNGEQHVDPTYRMGFTFDFE